MHRTDAPQRSRKSHPCKTPGQRVHGWAGEIHDGKTNSLSLLHDHDAKRAVEVTKHQFRGFMVAARGVNGGDRAASFAGPTPHELTAARSAVRSPAPSLPRTLGAPTAAARRPERTTVPGIAVPWPSSTCWGSYSVTSLRQKPAAIIGAHLSRSTGHRAMKRSQRDQIPRKDREPVGLAVSPASATIMKVAARHEADSKMDDPLCGSWERCRWHHARYVPEVHSGSLRWQK